MNRFFRSWQLIALSVVFLGMVACSDNDEPDTPISKDTKDILIGTRVANPDGMSGTAYVQLIKNIDPATYTNKQAFETNYTSEPIVRGKDVYTIPGWGVTGNVLKKQTLSNNQLVDKGEVELPANCGANALEIVGNKIYVSYSFMGKIGVFDKDKLTLIKEIDIAKYGIGDKNPDPCQMVGRDGILFVALNQIIGNTHMPDPKRSKVDVLLIDTKTDKPIKMITEETAGMSMPTKPELDDYSMFVDERGDIYINCISGFGFLGQESGFLRIKKGETDFDKSYQFKVTQTAIQGEANKASYIVMMRYVGKGIIYATANVPAYYSKQPNWFEDRVIFPVKIDLNAKTIKRLGTPRSNNFGVCVGVYKDKVIFGLSTTTDNGFFVYDPKTDKMSDKAVITTTGYPMCFLHLGE